MEFISPDMEVDSARMEVVIPDMEVDSADMEVISPHTEVDSPHITFIRKLMEFIKFQSEVAKSDMEVDNFHTVFYDFQIFPVNLILLYKELFMLFKLLRKSFILLKLFFQDDEKYFSHQHLINNFRCNNIICFRIERFN